MDSNIYCHKPNIILPSAFSTLVAIIGVFIAMNYYIRRRQMRRMGMMSSNTGGGGFGSLFGGSGGGGHQLCMHSLWSEVQRRELPAVRFQNEKSRFLTTATIQVSF